MFAGGGSVYLNVLDKYKNIIVNDVITDLIEIHKNIQDETFLNKSITLSKQCKHDKDFYLKLRDDYNNENKPEQLLALIWSCNSNMMRFNKSLEFNQTWGKRSANKNTNKKISIVKSLDLSNISYQSKHFNMLELEDYEDVFVYLDPPYSNTEAGYNALWSKGFDDVSLIELIKFYIKNNIAFGISGVDNGKENIVSDFLHSQNKLTKHELGDKYQKLVKKHKINQEYYFTNI